MLILTFDGASISNRDDFYQQFAAQCPDNEGFGDNLDALWDWVTGKIELPVTFDFQHLSTRELCLPLIPVLTLLKEAAQELGDQVTIKINGNQQLPEIYQQALA